MTDEYLEQAHNANYAKDMWKKTKNVFEHHTILHRLTARRQFYRVSMNDGEEVLSYHHFVKQLIATLKSMNVVIDDEEIAMAVLNGLLGSYEILITALDAIRTDDSSLSCNSVKSHLRQKEKRAELQQRSSSLSTLFLGTGGCSENSGENG